MNYPGISFEVIPRGKDQIDEVRATVEEGLKLNPLYIDMSFGGSGRPDVGGTIRDDMLRTIAVIRELTNVVPIVPHLSRTGLDVKNTQAFVKELGKMGIYRFLLVGGDQPKGDVPRFRDEDCYKETTDLITDVCDTFKFMGLGDKLELAVAVEPEGYKPVDRLKEKIAASAIRIPDELELAYAVKEAVTQNYTKTGILYPFLTQAIQAGIKIPIVPGVEVSAGIPQPKHDDDGNEVRNKANVLINNLNVPLHDSYMKLFEGIDPADRRRKTRDRLIDIHVRHAHKIVHELSLGQVGPGDIDITIDRVHGFTHNRTRFFDTIRSVYPGIEDAPPPARRVYGAEVRPAYRA